MILSSSVNVTFRVGVCCTVGASLPKEVCCVLLMSCSMSENAALMRCFTYLSLGPKLPSLNAHLRAHILHLGVKMRRRKLSPISPSKNNAVSKCVEV